MGRRSQQIVHVLGTVDVEDSPSPARKAATTLRVSYRADATGPAGFRCFTKKRVISTADRNRFGVLRQPWPSSGKRTYSTGTERFFRVSTTCSASVTGPIVSLAPWRTR